MSLLAGEFLYGVIPQIMQGFIFITSLKASRYSSSVQTTLQNTTASKFPESRPSLTFQAFSIEVTTGNSVTSFSSESRFFTFGVSSLRNLSELLCAFASPKDYFFKPSCSKKHQPDFWFFLSICHL